jgi:uncharacterized RDD family membrane protein YckC
MIEGAGGAALAWRRLSAYLLDWLVFLVYVALLLAAARLLLPAFGIDLFRWRPNPVSGQLLGLSTLTIPVLLYFAGFEASRWQATPGKRLMHLRVAANGSRASLPRTLARAGIKLLPWEISHTILWRIPGWLEGRGQPSTLQLLGFGCVGAVCLFYVASLFVGSGRTAYDRLTGTRVVSVE